jgi:hypothetical protein
MPNLGQKYDRASRTVKIALAVWLLTELAGLVFVGWVVVKVMQHFHII